MKKILSLTMIFVAFNSNAADLSIDMLNVMMVLEWFTASKLQKYQTIEWSLKIKDIN